MSFNPSDYMSNIQGRDYLEVKWRIVWFRDEHKSGTIETDLVNIEPPIVKATIYASDSTVLGTAHGSAKLNGKKAVWTGREIEKAETAAIGRALAHAGYGTQFTGESENDSLADSPVSKPAPKSPQAAQPAAANGDGGEGNWKWSNNADVVAEIAKKIGKTHKAVKESIQQREADGEIDNTMHRNHLVNKMVKAAREANQEPAA